MTDQKANMARVVHEAHELAAGQAVARAIEVLRAFTKDGGNADLAASKVGERLIEGGYLPATVALLGGQEEVGSARVLVVRGMARLGLGHYQPSAADFERALFLGVDDDAVRNAAIDGVVAALKALSVTRSGCPLYARKAEMWGHQPRADAGGRTWESWVSGEWSPREAFGGVAFGDRLPDTLLACICVLPDDEEERWSFRPPAGIVIATDEGRLDLVNTWESVQYRNRDLIGLRRKELEAILGPADAEERVLDMLYLSYDRLEIDIVLEDGVVTHAVVTGDGPRQPERPHNVRCYRPQ